MGSARERLRVRNVGATLELSDRQLSHTSPTHHPPTVSRFSRKRSVENRPPTVLTLAASARCSFSRGAAGWQRDGEGGWEAEAQPGRQGMQAGRQPCPTSKPAAHACTPPTPPPPPQKNSPVPASQAPAPTHRHVPASAPPLPGSTPPCTPRRPRAPKTRQKRSPWRRPPGCASQSSAPGRRGRSRWHAGPPLSRRRPACWSGTGRPVWCGVLGRVGCGGVE